MYPGNIAFLDENAPFQVREDRGRYDAEPGAIVDAEHLCEAQRLVGDALNLAGLLLASLEDQGDARAMQIHTAVSVIEEKLTRAFNRLDQHDASLEAWTPGAGRGDTD